MNLNFQKYLLDKTQASDCKELEVIQSLWSGYGKISRYLLTDSPLKSVVVKCISLHAVGEHPRGWNTHISHMRKLKSYEVETYWYLYWSKYCNDSCRVPKFLGSFSEGKDQWIILEDLDDHFPLRKETLDLSEIQVCLSWLANFHALFLGRKPTGLWEIGTYWHLDTRPEEYEKIERADVKAKAHVIDKVLNSSTYKTFVHGDAKLANFCFSADGISVAAVDFQYVGGGCGIKDVAYFLGSCLSGEACELYEDQLLNFYFSELGDRATDYHKDAIDPKKLVDEWRALYPLACADFTRFLLGWMPGHHKVNGYSLRILNSVLGGEGE